MARGSEVRLRPLWLGVRLTVGAVVLLGIVLGTVVGTDRWWPFAPMNQYAFSVPNDGDINSRYLEARTTEGTVVRVPLGRRLGLERAEIEGQLGRFVSDPALLQAVAVLHHRRFPDQPAYVELFLRNQLTRLPSRTVSVTTLSTWAVIDPHDPGELP